MLIACRQCLWRSRNSTIAPACVRPRDGGTRAGIEKVNPLGAAFFRQAEVRLNGGAMRRARWLQVRDDGPLHAGAPSEARPGRLGLALGHRRRMGQRVLHQVAQPRTPGSGPPSLRVRCKCGHETACQIVQVQRLCNLVQFGGADGCQCEHVGQHFASRNVSFCKRCAASSGAEPGGASCTPRACKVSEVSGVRSSYAISSAKALLARERRMIAAASLLKADGSGQPKCRPGSSACTSCASARSGHRPGGWRVSVSSRATADSSQAGLDRLAGGKCSPLFSTALSRHCSTPSGHPS